MAHYERLANGKYAYTTTVQVISPTEFTNPNHPYVSGTVAVERYLSNQWVTNNNIPQIVSAIDATPSNSICSSTTVILPNETPPKTTNFTYATKIINNETYYGVLCNTNKIINLSYYWKSSSGSDNYKWRVKNTKFEITYIPNGTTSIQTKTINVSASTVSKYSSSYTYTTIYLGLGMSEGDIILNINATPVE